MLGFGLLLIITAAVAFFGIFNVQNANSEFAYALEFPVERVNIAQSISTDVMNLRRIVTMIAFRHGQTEFLPALENEAIEVHRSILASIQNFRDSTNNDSALIYIG